MNLLRFLLPLTLTVGLSAQQQPFSLQLLRDLVEAVASGDYTEQRAISAIESRKVDFISSDENVAALRRYGASAKMIEAIVRVAPKPPPPPTGSLLLRCAPGDCEVRINQQAAGSSQNGRFVRDGLPLGEVVVDVTRAGYVPQQIKATITRDRGPEKSVLLEPNEATKVANGQALLRSVISALGSGEGASKMASFTGKGTIISHASGKQREMNFEIKAQPVAKLDMKASGQPGSVETKCDGAGCETQRGGGLRSRLKLGGGTASEVADELDQNLREFSRFSLPATIRTLSLQGVRVSATSAQPSGNEGEHLVADTGDAIYDVTVNSDFMPVKIEYTPKTGLGSGRTITYVQFVDIGNGARYPRNTTVLYKGGTAAQGVEVRLEQVKSTGK